jgi:hypothetical protein
MTWIINVWDLSEDQRDTCNTPVLYWEEMIAYIE